ncbi:MAG: DNA polymerase Y family protein [Actinomycetota bacterium]
MSEALPSRLATLWCADWPTVAAGCDPDHPAAVLAANRVVARTPAAAEQGVLVGQRRRAAQQRCPQLELIDHDPERDARVFEPALRAIADLSPRLDVIEPGWLSVATRGPSRYLGGEAVLVDRIAELAIDSMRTPVRVGVGVADGRFASGIAARLAITRQTPVVVDAGGSATFCAPLPIGWLHSLDEVDADLVELFTRLGIRRLGDLAVLDPVDVLGRFGPTGVHAHTLASGADPRPSSTVDPDPDRRVEHIFDTPVERSDPVVFVAKQLADEMAAALAAIGQVCTRLVVDLESEHGERSERSWYRSEGLNAAAVVERVRWQLDAWISLPRGSDQALTGGVSALRLAPVDRRADEGLQLGLWGGSSEADRRAGRAIARLSTLTSEHAVTVPVWNGGRLPADRYRWVPAVTVDLDQRARAVSSAGTGSGPQGPWPGGLPAPSPGTVLVEPLPIDVLDEGGRMVVVDGRGAMSAAPACWWELTGDEAGGWRRVGCRSIVEWAGPWPIEERWWEPERHRRLARLQIVADDGQAVLVAAEHRRWWLLARYD